MDYIAVEVNALCCLLPFVAFALLTLQFFMELPLCKSQQPNFAQLNDDFPFAAGGLISIKNQLNHRHLQNCSVNQQKNANTQKCKQQGQKSYLNEIRQETLQFGRKVLTGCNVGLAKMSYINKAYFRRNKAVDSFKTIRDQFRRKSKSSLIRRWFEPTSLVTIVEGLQY